MSGVQKVFFPDVTALQRNGSNGAIESVSFAEVLQLKTYVLLYFAASWCPDCCEFLPALQKFYEAHRESKSFEVIFIPCNKEAPQYEEDVRAVSWPAIPYAPKVTERVGVQLKVNSIPGLVVLDSATGAVVCGMNVADKLLDDPHGDTFPWRD